MSFTKKLIRQVLSIFTIIIFGLLAIGCARELHMSFNNTTKPPTPHSDTSNYLIHNNGSKIYGKNISYGTFLGKNIKIDNQKFSLKDIKGYVEDNVYYLQYGEIFRRRFIHGKISVYTSIAYDKNNYPYYVYYWGKGDDENLQQIVAKKDLIEILKDCPISVEMFNRENKEIKKAVKSDPDLFNKAFLIYNNNCKPL
jgi:hypothetical protein